MNTPRTISRAAVRSTCLKAVEVTTSNGTAKPTTIKWNRQIIGYSFGIPLSRIVDRIGIEPRITVWNVHAELPLGSADGRPQAVEGLDLNRTPSLDLLLDLEWIRGASLVRAWYAQGANVALLKRGARIESQGFGLDAFASGLLVLAYAVGNLGMKSVTTPILRRFGFRSVMIVNGLLTLSRPGTPGG